MGIGKKIGIVISCLAIVLAGVLLYMFYPAILGVINGSRYYSAVELQHSYDKGFDDGNSTKLETSEKLDYYISIVEDYETSIKVLNSEITKLNASNKEKEEVINSLNITKNQHLETISHLYTTIEEKELMIADLNNDIDGLNGEIENLNSQISTREATINRKNNEIAQLNVQVDSLNKQVQELTEGSENKDEEIVNLRSQIEVLEGTIVTKNAEIESLNTEILELEGINQGLNAEIVELNNTINNLSGENAEHMTTIGSLREQIGSLNNRIIILTTELTSAQNQIQELNTRIVNLQNTIEDYEEYIATLEASANLVVAIFEFDNKVYSIESVGDNHLVHVDNPVSTDNIVFNYWMVNGERVDLAVYEVTTTTKFIANVTYKHNVTFEVDGEVYNTQIVNRNNYITTIQEPIKEKHTFKGWSIDGYNLVDVYNLPITTDITFKAVFTSIYGLFNTDTGENIYTWDELIEYEYLALEGTTLSAGENYLRLSGDLYIDNDVVDIADNTFKNCSGLVRVNIPEGVKTIGKKCFLSNKSLEKITLPMSLISVGESAFSMDALIIDGTLKMNNVCYNGSFSTWANIDFENYTANPVFVAKNFSIQGQKVEGAITIPEDVTIIKKATFAGFPNDFIFHNGITSIGEHAFRESGLSFAILSDSVQSIGSSAFSKCSNLSSVKWPKDVSVINNSVFSGCTSLDNFDFSNITEIGDSAFSGCGFVEVTLPSQITVLEDYAFSGNNSLKTIYYNMINDNTETRMVGAFRKLEQEVDFICGDNVEYLKCRLFDDTTFNSIYIGKSVKDIHYYTFHDLSYTCKEFIFNATNCSVSRWNGVGPFRNLINNEVFKIGKDVEVLGYKFLSGDNVKNVVFEDNGLLTNIPDLTFSGCASLTSVYLPNTLKTMGYEVFYNCSKLVNVVMQEGVESVGRLLFKNCISLTNIDFMPKSLKTYAEAMFSGCSGLTSVDLSKVEVLEGSVFADCIGLINVEIPSNVTTLGNRCFNKCLNISLVEIFGNVQGSSYQAFYDVGSENNKVDFVVKEGVTKISSIAYTNYIGDITLPTTLINLSSSCFRGIAENLYFNCSTLARSNRCFQYLNTYQTEERFTLYVGENVEILESDLFMDSGLGKVIFAENSKLKTLGLGTFQDTYITSIVIPKSVETIGICCFEGCSKLTSIYISSTSCAIAPSTTSDSQLADRGNGSMVIYLAGAEDDYTYGAKWNVSGYSTQLGDYTYYTTIYNCSYDDYLNAITPSEV